MRNTFVDHIRAYITKMYGKKRAAKKLSFTDCKNKILIWKKICAQESELGFFSVRFGVCFKNSFSIMPYLAQRVQFYFSVENENALFIISSFHKTILCLKFWKCLITKSYLFPVFYSTHSNLDDAWPKELCYT